MARSRLPIANGGLFSTPTVRYSRETHDLLKVMMDESKLTNFQRKRLAANMERGESLPVHRHKDASAGCKPAQSTGKPCRNGSTGIRTKRTIDSLERNGEDPVVFTPPKYNSAIEKDRLYNIMALGREKECAVTSTNVENRQDDMESVDRFEEVLQEIEDRKEFLEEMEHLGQRSAYESQLSTEISQKIRELELIDKKRCQELRL